MGTTVRAFGPADGSLMMQLCQNECPSGQTPLLLTIFSDATVVGRNGNASAVYGESKINAFCIHFVHTLYTII